MICSFLLANLFSFLFFKINSHSEKKLTAKKNLEMMFQFKFLL